MKKLFAVTPIAFLVIGVFLSGCGSNGAKETAFKFEKNAGDVTAKASSVAQNQPVAEKINMQAVANAQETNFKPFPIYTDANSPDNHYFPSGWMGDYGDITYDDTNMTNPHSGTTCIKVVYRNKASQGARWAGVYWQNPPNNWGNRPGGYDLTGAKKLVFWARGENGGERIEEFKMGGMAGEYADSDAAGIGPVVLTQEWKQYVIDLDGKDLSSVSGGFLWATNLDANPEGAVFYLDDIRYE